MPIYDQAYRKYEAREALRTVRFWPITREALRLLLARKAFLALLVMTWAPLLGFVIYVWGLTRLGPMGADGVAAALPKGGAVFAYFFAWQMPGALLLTTFAGAGLVANDLRTGAILVYLSRPLTRRDYVFGKLSVLLALNLFVTLVPALLLYLVSIALAPEHFLKWELAWLAPGIVLQALVLSLAISLPALALSSLSRSSRVAGLAFFGLVMGVDAVQEIVGRVADWPATLLFSLRECVKALGNALLDPASQAAIPWVFPALVLVALGVGSLAVLRSRVRAVEIVR